MKEKKRPPSNALQSLQSKYSQTFEQRKEAIQKAAERTDQSWSRRTTTILGLGVEGMSDEGDYDVRILPAKDPTRPFFVTLQEHYIDHPGVNGGKPFSVKALCPRTFHNQCELCDHWDQQMWGVTGTPDQKKDKRKKLREKKANKPYLTRPRHYCLVLPEGSRPTVDNLLVLPFGNTIQQPLLTALKDDRYGGDFTNPITGFPVRITKVKTGSQPWDVEYSVKYDKRDSVPISDTVDQTKAFHEIEDLLDAMPDIHDLNREEYQSSYDGWLYTNAAINELMTGADPADVRKALSTGDTKPRKASHAKPQAKPAAISFADGWEDTDDNPDPYDNMTRTQLVATCKKRGLKTSKSYTEDQYRRMLRDDDDDIPF